MMKYEWLLFDADGTLFDYDEAEKSALASAFSTFSLPYSGDVLPIYREINDQMWRAFEAGTITQQDLKIERFQRLLDAVGADGAPTASAFSQCYLENLGKCADLIPDAERILQTLYGSIHLALITNGIKEVQRSRLARSTIGGYFEAVAISGELGVAKPDAGIFDAVFAAMGNPGKDRVLIIGDSLSSDMQGGRDYGIDTCWFNPHGKLRDPSDHVVYEIQNLVQILDIVKT